MSPTLVKRKKKSAGYYLFFNLILLFSKADNENNVSRSLSRLSICNFEACSKLRRCRADRMPRVFFLNADTSMFLVDLLSFVSVLGLSEFDYDHRATNDICLDDSLDELYQEIFRTVAHKPPAWRSKQAS